MTPEQKQWVLSTASEAASAKHVWPEMAACEGALESAFGESKLAVLGNNLFGMKAHATATSTLALPTKEFINGDWIATVASWMKYATLEDCFLDRMATLYRLRHTYAHYDAALNATSAEEYIRGVSKTWSTDPNRAEKVLGIYNEIFPQVDTVVGESTA